MTLTHTKRMSFDYDGVGMIGSIADNNSPEKAAEEGWTGSVDAQQEVSLRVVKDDVSLNVNCQTVTMAMLKKLLETMFTDLTVATAPALADPSAASTQIVVKHDRVIDKVQYSGLWVNSLKISVGGANAKLQAEVNLLGSTARNFLGGTPVSIVHALPLANIDATITHNSITQTPQVWEILIENNLEEDFANSKTRVAVGQGPRVVTAKMNLPVNATSFALFDDVLADSGVKAFSVAITDGTSTATITLPEVGVVGSLPSPGDGVWRGDLELQAFEPASGDIVTVTYI